MGPERPLQVMQRASGRGWSMDRPRGDQVMMSPGGGIARHDMNWFVSTRHSLLGPGLPLKHARQVKRSVDRV